MSPATFMSLAALMLLVSNSICLEEGGNSDDGTLAPTACLNCSLCENPCGPLTPPPPSYLSFAAPPPPPAPVQGNCPPSTSVQCCQNPPPRPNYFPYYNNSASSPFFSSFLFSFLGVFISGAFF
ncbi:uncharacterized protein LOC131255150 [Magnolia sinica]|uniref:uncharacterized protein LOC131255150 n=1 Tax=Magnolia sinica TaxID=86752 RepID=UPI00265AE008|nr:uncharacterized protein LOC131255150 [Magnolia sinica]